MTNNQNLQNLIDEVMGDFHKQFDWLENDVSVNYYIREMLVRIAKATAEAGKIGQMRNKIKDSVYPEYFKGRNDGWNMAGKQQQKQLKEFLGDVSNRGNKK